MTREDVDVRTAEVRWRGVAAGASDSPTLLLLPGFPEDRRSWDPQLDALAAAGFRAVAVDLPGIGASSPPASYRIEHVAARLADLSRALGDDVHVVGHDWGAILAAATSAAHQAAFRSVTLSGGPHPRAFRAVFRSPRQLLRSWYVAAFQLPGAALVVGAAGGAAPSALFRIRSPISGWRDAQRALAYYRENMGPARVARHRVGRIRVPALVIHGARDPHVGVELMEESARWCDDVRGFHVLDGGHFVHRDRGGEWRRLLLRFVRSVEGATREGSG